MNHTIQKTAAQLRDERLGRTGKASEILAGLFDEGTFAELGAYRKDVTHTENEEEPVITGYGAVEGRLVFAFIQNFDNKKGAMSAAHADKICALYAKACKSGAPVVGVFDSAGAPVLEGPAVLEGYARVMKAASDAKNRVPQIALIAGICTGSAAVLASLFDFTLADAEKAVFAVTPPFLCGGKGGSAAEAAKRGDVQLVCENCAALLEKTRSLLTLIPASNTDGAVMTLSEDELNRPTGELEALLAAPSYAAVDLIKILSDDGSFFPLASESAPSLVTGFAQIDATITGVLMTDPAQKDGVLTNEGAWKAARFLSFCSRFSIPVLTLLDAKGVAADPDGKGDGFAALIRENASFKGSMVTVVVGNAYGAVYPMLASATLHGGVVLALDRASISVMKPEAAAAFFGDASDKKERLAAWQEEQASPLRAAQDGLLDDIVSCEELRMRILSAFEMQA